MESSMDAIAFPQATFHHIGFVVASIENSVEGFLQFLHDEWNGKIFHDPNQVVKVTFLHSKRPGNPVLELVEPAGDKSPVTPFLKRGGGLHHLCYEIDNLEEQLRWSRTQGASVVRPPLPAVAFEGRRIAWVYTRNKVLVKYLERQKRSAAE